MVQLVPVNEENFKKVVRLKLPPEQQGYVAENLYSLAQAWLYYKEARPFAICVEDEVVGFLMLDWDEEEHDIGLWRFMIGSEYQKRGYGRAALSLVIDMARNAEGMLALYLDYVPDNVVAEKLYRSFGFQETGEIEDGEIVMKLAL